MNKTKFLHSLNEKLCDLPQDEVEERLHFYSEMIEDRIEDGLTEEEAISEIGTVSEIAQQIKSDISGTVIPKNASRKPKAWSIVLIILGAPLWLSLLIAVAAIIFFLYISACSVVVSLWAVFISLVASAIGGLISGIILCIIGKIPSGIALIASAFVCAGLSIFLYFGCKALSKLMIILTRKIFTTIKNRLHAKEAAQ